MWIGSNQTIQLILKLQRTPHYHPLIIHREVLNLEALIRNLSYLCTRVGLLDKWMLIRNFWLVKWQLIEICLDPFGAEVIHWIILFDDTLQVIMKLMILNYVYFLHFPLCFLVILRCVSPKLYFTLSLLVLNSFDEYTHFHCLKYLLWKANPQIYVSSCNITPLLTHMLNWFVILLNTSYALSSMWDTMKSRKK